MNGKAFKPSDWTETGLPIVRIQNLNNPDAPFNRSDGEVAAKFHVSTGQLLVAWSGTPGTSFGAHVRSGGPAVLNQHIFKVEFNEDKLDKQFLAGAINQKLDELIGKAHGGVGLRHVTKGVFEATEVGVPPLAEQRRIVAKLDRLSAKRSAAEGHLARISKLAARAKQSILAAAFRGDLTADWQQMTVEGVLADGLIGLVRSKTQQSDCGTPYIRMNHYDLNGCWNDRDLTHVEVSAKELERFELTTKDILFNTRNSVELVGTRPARPR
ncbi:restriction endonuclease subunit S [Acuticoccus sp.]|uniref:restriction endonuclease subunit S n=1 Tax=Acuticoccus sp. TaxID=1904378 RepID=UPI003B52A943